MENKDNEVIGGFVSINENYYDMEPDDQREFLRNLLRSMSPNPEVRAKAKPNKKK